MHHETVTEPNCQFCGATLNHSLVDLGVLPLSNTYLTPHGLRQMEPFYPLKVYVCASCFLVQVPEFESPDQIFRDYAYFSSYSQSWLEHCRIYAEQMVRQLELNRDSLVIEIASNDGYLLKYFKEHDVPVLGVEPARNVASIAMTAGIPTVVEFLGVESAEFMASQGRQADLLIGNNVLAHVPDLNDFVGGLKILLKGDGLITMEFPHLLKLLAEGQFDTIYHEHFSYLSFHTVRDIFAHHGLNVMDVEELPTHGGSLRIQARHSDQGDALSARAQSLLQREEAAGLRNLHSYEAFKGQAQAAKLDLVEFLIKARRDGKTVAGYGAPAKGNTLLNYCGVGPDLLPWTVDLNPHKQNKFLPGSHIPIFGPAAIDERKPDYLLILPWNLKDEITEQMAHVRQWGCQFVVAIPHLAVF